MNNLSKSAKILAFREQILTSFNNYLSLARGIDDLESEEDYQDIQFTIDTLLEDFYESSCIR